MTELTTERLELRRWRANDLDDYAALAADPDVTRYIGGPQDRATAWRQLALFLGHRELRGWTTSAAVELASGRLIGRAGLWQPEGEPSVELIWILRSDAWGLGYATELAAAIRDYAFGELGISHLIASIHPDNGASIRVAEKIGATVERRQDVNGESWLVYGLGAPA